MISKYRSAVTKITTQQYYILYEVNRERLSRAPASPTTSNTAQR